MSDKHGLIETQLAELKQMRARLRNIGVALLQSGHFSNGRGLCLRAQRARGMVLDLEQDLWDIDPERVDREYRPELEVDLSKNASALDHEDPVLREGAVEEMLFYAPGLVVENAKAAAGPDERARILRDWWGAPARDPDA